MDKIDYRTLSHEEFQKIISDSTSIREILLKCGLKGEGCNHTKLNKFLKDNNFDCSTLVGRSIYRNTRNGSSLRALNSVLIENSNIASAKLKGRLFNSCIKERKCEICGITDWHGEKLSFELHHINGNHQDNRLENLIVLCPNCHSLTHNFRGKNSNYEKEKSRFEKLLEEKSEEMKRNLPQLIQDHIEILEAKRLDCVKGNKKHKVVKEPTNKCKQCGELTNNKVFCSSKCRNDYQRRNKPSKEQLLELSKECHSLSELTRKLNLDVTDNAIKKHCVGYGIYDEIKKNFKQKTYPILQYTLNNEFIKEWKDGDTIAKELGFCKHNIQHCCKGLQKSSNGYIWRYK